MTLGLAPVIVGRLLPVVREYATSTSTGVLRAAKSLSSDGALLAASY